MVFYVRNTGVLGAHVLLAFLRLPHCFVSAIPADELGGYADEAYWDKRYADAPRKHEWYSLDWRILNSTLGPRISASARVLHVGIGNSDLASQMYDAGFRSQVACDISSEVVRQMRERYVALAPHLEFAAEDATNLSFPDESFDLVLEKATLQALGSERQCGLGEEGCRPSPAEDALITEAFRVLKPGGLFASVSDEILIPKALHANISSGEQVPLGKELGVVIPKNLFLAWKVKGGEASLRDKRLDGKGDAGRQEV